jgi:hypothetical protein
LRSFYKNLHPFGGANTGSHLQSDGDSATADALGIDVSSFLTMYAAPTPAPAPGLDLGSDPGPEMMMEVLEQQAAKEEAQIDAEEAGAGKGGLTSAI